MSSLSAPAKPERISIPVTQYLGLTSTASRLRPELAIEVSPRAFLPRFDDLQADWVASVATPAFKLIQKQQGNLTSFASIGTGTGLDALAAIETLGVNRVGITDVHDDVVSSAARNISHNLKAPVSVDIEAGFGDLLSPLAHYKPRYDLIYENLPNVPINDAARIASERTSSGHVPPRPEPVPDSVKQNLLTLHYLALKQSRDFLTASGSVLSMLGGRIPLQAFLEMANLAGFKGEIFTYTWKVQADAEDMIRGHAERQREGFGPFYFYRTADLARVFKGIDLASSGKRALELEQSLVPHRLNADQAFEAFRRGDQIGHTAVVLRSRAH